MEDSARGSVALGILVLVATEVFHLSSLFPPGLSELNNLHITFFHSIHPSTHHYRCKYTLRHDVFIYAEADAHWGKGLSRLNRLEERGKGGGYTGDPGTNSNDFNNRHDAIVALHREYIQFTAGKRLVAFAVA